MKFFMVHPMLSVFVMCLLASCIHGRPNTKMSNKKNFLRNTRNGNAVSSRPAVLKMRVVPPAELTLPLASSKVLECEAGGNPSPTIHWLKNGKSLVDSNEVLAVENEENPRAMFGFGFTRSRLYLDCLQPDDEGLYTCVADNAFERRSASSSIRTTDIMRDSDIISEASSNNLMMCANKKAFGSPAKIIMWTKSRLELMGSDVRLFCRSQGYPKPNISWLSPDGSVLVSGDKTSILEDGDLIIRDLRWEDMGGYQCLASNQDGDDKTTTFVYPMQPEKS